MSNPSLKFPHSRKVQWHQLDFVRYSFPSHFTRMGRVDSRKLMWLGASWNPPRAAPVFTQASYRGEHTDTLNSLNFSLKYHVFVTHKYFLRLY